MNTSSEFNLSRETKDWVFTRSDEVAVEQGCSFDYNAAAKVRAFFKKFIRHSKGPFAKMPFELMPWQWNNVIGPAFGWKMPDGSRRFKEVEIWIPKKNGKSTLMAAVALYLLAADNEEGAEIYSAASDRNQASLIYTEACSMIKKSPILKRNLRVRKTVKEVHYDNTNSIYKVISAAGFRNEGYNIHGLLFDELHTQQNRKLWAALRYGTAARRQGIKFVTSTAGEDDETLLWYERFNLAKKVQDNQEVDIHLLACVYALTEEEYTTDAWRNEATWKRINPGYGSVVNAIEFKRDYENSQKSSANEVEFLRYRLNKSTKYMSAWIRQQYWSLGKSDGLERIVIKPKLYVGVDLADTVDLNAAILGYEVVHPKKGNCIKIDCHFWAAEESVHKLNGVNADRYKQWFQSGYLNMIPGPVAEQDVIEDEIIPIILGRNTTCIGIDRFNATRFALSMNKKLKAVHQETDIRLVSYNAATMNNAVRWMEELIYTGRIIHDDNPIMNWMFGNVKCVEDSSQNRKLDKSSSQGKKIDGFSALCIMMYCMINLEPKFESKYNTPGTKPGTVSMLGAKQ